MPAACVGVSVRVRPARRLHEGQLHDVRRRLPRRHRRRSASTSRTAAATTAPAAAPGRPALHPDRVRRSRADRPVGRTPLARRAGEGHDGRTGAPPAPPAEPHHREREKALPCRTERAPPPPSALASSRHVRRPPDDRRRRSPLHDPNIDRLASSAVRWAAFASVAAGVVMALSVAQLATGQSIDRVRVAPNPPVASVPTGLFLVVGSPNAYSRASLSGGRGSWVGPGYAPLGSPSPWGNASIDWEVGYDTRRLDTERIALANLTRDWQEDQRAGASIPHVVGGRVVGDIPGFFVLQVVRQSAPSELVVAFPLSRDVHAYVRFLLTQAGIERLLRQRLDPGVELEPRPGARRDVPRPARREPAALAGLDPLPTRRPPDLRVRAGLRPPPRRRDPRGAGTPQRQRVEARRDRSHDADRRLHASESRRGATGRARSSARASRRRAASSGSAPAARRRRLRASAPGCRSSRRRPGRRRCPPGRP